MTAAYPAVKFVQQKNHPEIKIKVDLYDISIHSVHGISLEQPLTALFVA
jgi:hypothetical protein